MQAFVPSDLARLVYGYLEEVNCIDAAKLFLSTALCLQECLELSKNGKTFHTRMFGKTLKEITDSYCEADHIVNEYFSTLPYGNAEDLLQKLKPLFASSTNFAGNGDKLISKKPAAKRRTAIKRKSKDVTTDPVASKSAAVVGPKSTSTPVAAPAFNSSSVETVPSQPDCLIYPSINVKPQSNPNVSSTVSSIASNPAITLIPVSQQPCSTSLNVGPNSTLVRQVKNNLTNPKVPTSHAIFPVQNAPSSSKPGSSLNLPFGATVEGIKQKKKQSQQKQSSTKSLLPYEQPTCRAESLGSIYKSKVGCDTPLPPSKVSNIGNSVKLHTGAQLNESVTPNTSTSKNILGSRRLSNSGENVKATLNGRAVDLLDTKRQTESTLTTPKATTSQMQLAPNAALPIQAGSSWNTPQNAESAGAIIRKNKNPPQRKLSSKFTPKQPSNSRLGTPNSTYKAGCDDSPNVASSQRVLCSTVASSGIELNSNSPGNVSLNGQVSVQKVINSNKKVKGTSETVTNSGNVTSTLPPSQSMAELDTNQISSPAPNIYNVMPWRDPATGRWIAKFTSIDGKTPTPLSSQPSTSTAIVPANASNYSSLSKGSKKKKNVQPMGKNASTVKEKKVQPKVKNQSTRKKKEIQSNTGNPSSARGKKGSCSSNQNVISKENQEVQPKVDKPSTSAANESFFPASPIPEKTSISSEGTYPIASSNPLSLDNSSVVTKGVVGETKAESVNPQPRGSLKTTKVSTLLNYESFDVDTYKVSCSNSLPESADANQIKIKNIQNLVHRKLGDPKTVNFTKDTVETTHPSVSVVSSSLNPEMPLPIQVKVEEGEDFCQSYLQKKVCSDGLTDFPLPIILKEEEDENPAKESTCRDSSACHSSVPNRSDDPLGINEPVVQTCNQLIANEINSGANQVDAEGPNNSDQSIQNLNSMPTVHIDLTRKKKKKKNKLVKNLQKKVRKLMSAVNSCEEEVIIIEDDNSSSDEVIICKNDVPQTTPLMNEQSYQTPEKANVSIPKNSPVQNEPGSVIKQAVIGSGFKNGIALSPKKNVNRKLSVNDSHPLQIEPSLEP